MNHHITKAAVHRQYKLCYHVSPIFWTGTLTKLVRCICVATVVQNITKTISWFICFLYTITHTSSCSSTNHINKPNILYRTFLESQRSFSNTYIGLTTLRQPTRQEN